MTRSVRHVFNAKKNERDPEEVERFINEAFAVLRQLSSYYADIHPWASLFQNRMDRQLIDEYVCTWPTLGTGCFGS